MKLLQTRLERILIVRPIWLIHWWIAKIFWTLTSGRKRNPEFLKNSYVTGHLPQTEINRLMVVLKRTPVYAGFTNAPLSSYTYDETKGVRAVDYNRGRYFFKLTAEHLAIVRDWLRTLAPGIEEAAGFYWRPVNIFCSREDEHEKPNGEREWHHDRFADGAFKVLVYLTGAGPEIGTTEVCPEKGRSLLIEGPPGTWMFFDNNALLHRAIVAKKGSRHLLQVTIAPAFRTTLDPAHVPDGQYPKLPWKPASSPLAVSS